MSRAFRVATARNLTPKEHTDAARLIHRRAINPEDEQQLLNALGLTTEETNQ